jgi:DNA-binding Xre family transcriptional regulator
VPRLFSPVDGVGGRAETHLLTESAGWYDCEWPNYWQRGLKPYDLITGAGFSPHASYKLASEDGRFERIGADTIDRLCEFLGVLPGDLFERTSDVGAGRRRTLKRRGAS